MKRTFDIIGGVLVLIVATPLILLIAVFVRLTSPGPVIFRQLRVGKDGVPFVIYKFRSMTHDTKRPFMLNVPLTAPCVTPLGRLLRRSRCDELPQLFNVLQGTMSLVGPRPYAVEEVELKKELFDLHTERTIVRPGLVGPGKLHGRSLDTELFHDTRYSVLHFSLTRDVMVVLRTPIALIRSKIR